jgi:cytochrome c556
LKIIIPLVLSVALATAGVAVAQSRGAAQAGARQANFKQMGGAFKAINDELKKGAPDAALIRANATKLNALAGKVDTWFPSGSGAESGAKSEAKPDVWANPAGFRAAANALKAEAPRLLQVATNGDLEAMKAQARVTGGACKGCHDKFRTEKK